MNTKETALSFSSLVSLARERFKSLTDPRKRIVENSYPLEDAVMSALAMFHFQDPSFLKFQKALEDSERKSNLTTLFKVSSVPKSTQMRTLIDGVSPSEVAEVFDDFHRRVSETKLLSKFRFMDGRYLLLLDGSEYFSSNCRWMIFLLIPISSFVMVSSQKVVFWLNKKVSGFPRQVPVVKTLLRLQVGFPWPQSSFQAFQNELF